MGNFNYFKRRLGKVLTPLNEKLKSVEWGEFRVGDLFEIGTGSLLSNDELKKGNIPRVSAKSDNNGIIGYFDTENLEKARHFENFISVNFFGTDGGIFYHPYKASVEMKVHTLKIPNVSFNLYNATFIIGALKKILKGFGYGEQLSSSKLKNLNFYIKLPTKNGKIDFEFMEEFIKEIEKAKLKKIKEYLKENNLENTNLTEKEKEALERFKKNQIEWKEFKIEDLFNVKSSKRKFDSNKITILDSGRPYVVRMSSNNGIKGYLKEDEKFLNDGNTISFGQDTATVFYQKEPYFTGDKIKILQLKEFDLSKFKGLFFVTTIRKSFSCFQWGGTSFSEKVIKNQQIFLPIKNNKIDFEFMENLISALEKNLIKKILNAFKGKI